MAGRRGVPGKQRAAWRTHACLLAASLALLACRVGSGDGQSAQKREAADWKSRVSDARTYAERRKKEWVNLPVQSAIGVEILAGEPNAGVKTGGATKSGTPAATPPAGPPSPPVPPPNLSAEQMASMRERARNAVGIVVYTTSWCGVCSTARDHMRQRRIAFVERNVGARPDWKRKLGALNPKNTVPTFDIDGLVMIGFGAEPLDQLILRASDARLARLLQSPKTAALLSRP